MKKEDVRDVTIIEKESFSVPWSENSFSESLEQKNSIFLVAIEDDEIIGYLGCYKIFNEADITNIAVSKPHKKKGVATKLLEDLITKLKEKDVNSIFLEVRESNVAATNLYEKLGFIKSGTRRNFYEAPLENATIMIKFL